MELVTIIVVSSVKTGMVEPVYRGEGVFESAVEGEGTCMGNYIIVLKLSYPHTYYLQLYYYIHTCIRIRTYSHHMHCSSEGVQMFQLPKLDTEWKCVVKWL